MYCELGNPVTTPKVGLDHSLTNCRASSAVQRAIRCLREKQRPRPSRWQSVARRPHLSLSYEKAPIELFDSTQDQRQKGGQQKKSRTEPRSFRRWKQSPTLAGEIEAQLQIISTLLHFKSKKPFTCHETCPRSLRSRVAA